jgi:nucleotide-binding universal stress UspA family protein
MKVITLGYDCSPAAQVALARAQRLALGHRANLHIVQVLEAGAAPVDRKNALARLKVEQRVATVDADDVAFVVLDGDPAVALSQAADAADADLIIIGGHQAKRWTDVAFGTTAEALLRWSERPLLIARAAPEHDYSQAVAAIDSEKSMRAALALASLVGATALMAVHAYELPFEAHVIGGEVTATIKAEETNAFRERMKRIPSPANLKVEAMAIEDDIVVAIEQASQASNADLVILTTHARAGLRWLLRGSVADTVLERSPRDVLVGRLPPHRI